jgi:hypothetical protein
VTRLRGGNLSSGKTEWRPDFFWTRTIDVRCFDRVAGKLAPSESLLPVIPIPDTLACGMRNRVRLEIIGGPLKGKKFQFAERDTFIFGRASDCHAHLSDDTLVSRHHFILEVNPPLAR